MATLWFDLSDAVKGLRRDFAFSAIAIATLALTLGAVTAVYSIVDGVLLKPLPYAESDRLVSMREEWKELAQRVPTVPINEQHFEYWRQHAVSFDAVAQYLPLPANLTSGGEAAQVSVARATSSLFDVLRVRPALGRGLAASDEPRGAPDVAVISDALWRGRFGADPTILGKAIVLDGRPYQIVGVLPRMFRLPVNEQLVSTVDAFVPLRVESGWAGDHNNVAVGRLRSGVSLEAAREELDLLQSRVSVLATKESGEKVTLAARVEPLVETVVGRARRGLWLLFAAIVAVMLIASSNLANLALTRAIGRTREGAIRSALGASRARLVRRVVLEQLTLALCGGALGLWLASTALTLFVRTAPVDLPRIDEVVLDARVIAFAFGVAAVTGLLVAILPAWHLSGRDVQVVLRAGGTVAGADRAGVRSRAALLALQVAMSVTLLVVTSLLVVSLMNVLKVDRGFNAERVIAVPVSMPVSRYGAARVRVDAIDRILGEVRRIAGVQAVSSTSLLPMRGGGQVNFIVAAGSRAARSEQPSANFRFVAPEFFQTLQLPLVRGRTFGDNERDPARPAPAVISQSAAERLWPGLDALGRRFSRGFEGEQGFEVVGIATDARTTSIEDRPPLMVYVPYWWQPRTSASLLIRTEQEPTAVVAEVRRAVARVDAEIAVGQARTLDEMVHAATAARRYQSQLFVAFGVVAFLIATLGVYAVTSYTVSRRRREINIRVALGAAPASMFALVARQTAIAVVAGLVAGGLGALLLGGVLASLLYDVTPRDPLVLASVALSVGGVALLATLAAARRGLDINPVAALRED